MWSAAQQLGAVDGGLGLLALRLEAVELRAVVVQLAAEFLDSFVCLFLLGWDQLALCERVVVVEGAREGCEGCGYLALQRQ